MDGRAEQMKRFDCVVRDPINEILPMKEVSPFGRSRAFGLDYGDLIQVLTFQIHVDDANNIE